MPCSSWLRVRRWWSRPAWAVNGTAVTGRIAVSTELAVVTGGGRGIGAAISRRLAVEDHDVVVTYQQAQDAAENVAGTWRSTSSGSLPAPSTPSVRSGAPAAEPSSTLPWMPRCWAGAAFRQEFLWATPFTQVCGVIRRCVHGVHIQASNKAGAVPPPVPPGSGESGAFASRPAWRPRSSR